MHAFAHHLAELRKIVEFLQQHPDNETANLELLTWASSLLVLAAKRWDTISNKQ